MAKKKPLIEQSFESDFGTVNVGDTVVAVTTGFSHRVKVFKAKYIGYIESSTYFGAPHKKVKLEYDGEDYVWYHKGTNTPWKPTYAEYMDPDFPNKFESRKTLCTRTTTLQLNRIAPISRSGEVNIDIVQNLV